MKVGLLRLMLVSFILENVTFLSNQSTVKDTGVLLSFYSLCLRPALYSVHVTIQLSWFYHKCCVKI